MALSIGEISALVGIGGVVAAGLAAYIGRDRVIVGKITQARDEMHAVEKTLMVGMATVEKANLVAVENAKEIQLRMVDTLHERIGKLRTDHQVDAADIRKTHVPRSDMDMHLAPLIEAQKRTQSDLATLIQRTGELSTQVATLIGHLQKQRNGG